MTIQLETAMRHPLMIKELPSDERPREKLRDNGAQVMSNSELLAILLRSGNQDESALRLAEHLLERQGGLAGLGGATAEALEQVKGIGEAKASTVLAAIELGRRVALLEPAQRLTIKTPDDVAALLLPRFRYESREHFLAVLLSTKNHVLKTAVISIGSLNASIVHPRELFREAINCRAAAVILAHNHPSGNATPSNADQSLTQTLKGALQLLDVRVLDHIIVTANGCRSMAEMGLV